MKQKSIKLKYLFEFGKGLSITKENLSETGIPCVSYGQVHSKYGVILDMSKHVLPFVSESYLDASPQALIQQGDFVFADTSEDKAGSGNFTCLVSDSSIFAGYHTVIARPISKDVFYKYFAYLFDSQEFRAQIQQAVSGIKVFTISQGMLKNGVASFPSFQEQVVIANYLDRKTAQIDSIIADKEKLIELLKEKRQAIISEAVTRGLDPSVPMKDSGVDWIGQIPKNWQIKKTKYVFEIVKRIYGKEDRAVLSITQKGIKIRDIESNDGQLAQDYSNYQIVNVNDFAMNSMDLLTGFVDCSKFEGVTSPDYRVFRFIPGKELCHSYYNYLFQLCYSKRIFYRFGQGVSNFGRWRLQTETFKNFYIPVPPAEEQEKISLYLLQKNIYIDNLISTAEQQISLLKEYRQSVISEAVTGKVAIS